MSLIFTSNTQDEYAELNLGIENPSDYHNHLTSPLEVKPDSQIAVQSVKISRKNVWKLEDAKQMLYYFGRPLQTAPAVQLEDVTSRPKLVEIPKGTYNHTQFADALETQMKLMKVSPALCDANGVNNMQVNTSFVGAEFKGFEISCSQNGSTYVTPAIQTTSRADVVVATTLPTRPTSDGFTYGAGGKTGVFDRTTGDAGAGDINDGLCCGILPDFPLGIGEGSSFITDLQGASYDITIGQNGNASWVVGLTRPTVQLLDFGPDIGIAPQGFETEAFMPHFFDYVAIFSAQNGSRSASAVEGHLKLYQGSYLSDADGKPVPDSYKLHEILYYGGTNQPAVPYTNANFNGSATTQFIKVEWQIHGDEVRLNLKTRAGDTTRVITTAFNAEQARCFKPTTDFTTALYPKLILAHDNTTLTVEAFTSYQYTLLGAETYKYPTYLGYDGADMSGGTYTVGDSSYANEISYVSSLMKRPVSIAGDVVVVGQAKSWARQGISVIKPPDTTYGQMLPETVSATNTLTFQGLGATTDGVDYEHLLVLEDTTPAGGGGIGNYFSENCNIGRALGFPDIAVLNQRYGTLSLSDKQVLWVSGQVPQGQGVHSAFVRLSNLTQRSYNATKNSVSKMLYHIPRFTNDGRQFGELFFEVSERTYVDLGNTDSFMLNQFQVSICDKSERIVDDLEKDTIVVFHIRSKADAGKYS